MAETLKEIYSSGTVLKKMSARQDNGTSDNFYQDFYALIKDHDSFSGDIFWLAVDTLEILSPLKHHPDYSINDRKIIFLLIFFILNKESQGSTRYPLNSFFSDISALGIQGLQNGNVLFAAKKYPELFTENPADIKPFIIESHFAYVQRTYINEKMFFSLFYQRLKNQSRYWNEKDTLDALTKTEKYLAKNKKIELHSHQKNAVMKSISQQTLLITGGPGTGKTTIALSIILFLSEMGVLNRKDYSSEVALTAPTGRAANRMFETLKEDFPADNFPYSSTIHRLLGYSPITGKFSYHQNNPLDYKLIIVDEASMIDLFLFTSLLKAIKPETRLIILGDARQLPSVEKGTVFSDIILSCNPATPWMEFLTHTYRQNSTEGKQIIHLAEYINHEENHHIKIKDSHPDWILGHSIKNFKIHEKPVCIIETPDKSYQDLNHLMNLWYARFYQNAQGRLQRVFNSENGIISGDDRNEIELIFNEYNSNRILCLTNLSYRGTQHINDLFKKAATGSFTPAVYAGAPIIILRNKYNIMQDADLYNGDMGIVLSVSEKNGSSGLKMVFKIRDKFRVIDMSRLYYGDFSLAYSITVHKSQGSEYEHVALILPENESRLLSKEILYTAVTRAKKSITIFGKSDVLDKGKQKSENLSRDSGIKEKMSAIQDT